MNKKDIEHAVAQRLRSDDVRKHISFKPDDLFIRLGDGKETKLSIAPIDRGFIYTQEDVSNVVTAFLEVICERVSRGDRVVLRGFGSFEPHKRKGRQVKRFGSDVWDDVPDLYLPKFTSGEWMNLAARLYGESIKDKDAAASAKSAYIGGVT